MSNRNLGPSNAVNPNYQSWQFDPTTGIASPSTQSSLNATLQAPSGAAAVAAAANAVGITQSPAYKGRRYALFGDSTAQRGLAQINASGSVVVANGIGTFTGVGGHGTAPGNWVQVVPTVAYRSGRQYNFNCKVLTTPSTTQLTFDAWGMPDGTYPAGSGSDTFHISPHNYRSDGEPFFWYDAYAQSNMILTGMYAIGGTASSELVNALPNALDARGPAWDVGRCQTGINNIQTITGGSTPSQVAAIIDQIVSDHVTWAKAVMAAGKTAEILITTGQGTANPTYLSAKSAAVAQLRMKLLALRYTIPGLIVLDGAGDAVNQTGDMITNYSLASDGVHLGNNGALGVGRIEALKQRNVSIRNNSLLVPASVFDDAYTNAQGWGADNIMPNGLFTGTAGTAPSGTVADGWQVANAAGSATVVCTAGQAPTLAAGEVSNRANWGYGQRINITFAGATDKVQLRSPNMAAKITAGGYYMVGLLVYLNADPVNWEGVNLNFYTGGDANYRGSNSKMVTGLAGLPAKSGDLILLTFGPFYIDTPPATLQMYFFFEALGVGSLDMQVSSAFCRQVGNVYA